MAKSGIPGTDKSFVSTNTNLETIGPNRETLGLFQPIQNYTRFRESNCHAKLSFKKLKIIPV